MASNLITGDDGTGSSIRIRLKSSFSDTDTNTVDVHDTSTIASVAWDSQNLIFDGRLPSDAAVVMHKQVGFSSTNTATDITLGNRVAMWNGNIYELTNIAGSNVIREFIGFQTTSVNQTIDISATSTGAIKGIDFDSSGNLCVMDLSGATWKIMRFTGISNTLSTSFTDTDTFLSFAHGLTILDGDPVTYRRKFFGAPTLLTIRYTGFTSVRLSTFSPAQQPLFFSNDGAGGALPSGGSFMQVIG